MRSFLFPLVYCIGAGTSWSMAWKKRFIESLAPAMILHVLLILISGMTVGKLMPGFLAGIVVMAGTIVIFSVIGFMSRGLSRKDTYLSGSEKEGCEERTGLKQILNAPTARRYYAELTLFIGLYLLIYVLNIGKRFITWDEFSHWGRFIKESLRLDALYCTSTAPMAHPDYPPAGTLIQYIWCRLCGRYTEAETYRGMQIFMFCMILPMCRGMIHIRGNANEQDTSETKKKDASVAVKHGNGVCVSRLLPGLLVVLLLLPLIFNTDNGFQFYHSIYQDYLLGVVIFYCMWITVFGQDTNNAAESAVGRYRQWWYQDTLLAIALSFLVLTKIVGFAFWAMVLAYRVVRSIPLIRREVRWIVPLIVPILLPVLMELWFARYLGNHMSESGGSQSLSGLDIGELLSVYFAPATSGIAWLGQIRTAFISAIFSYDILLKGSYVLVLIAVTIVFGLLVWDARRRLQHLRSAQEDAQKLANSGKKAQREERAKILEQAVAAVAIQKSRVTDIILTGLWLLFAGIAYAFMMYGLYCTEFSEYEAVRLTSYARYMNIFSAAAILLTLAVIVETGACDRFEIPFWCMTGGLAVILFFHVSAFTQMIPGGKTQIELSVAQYENLADALSGVASEDESIYILARGDTGYIGMLVGYYASPRTIFSASVGTEAFEGDVWSRDIEPAEFAEDVAKYDCLYLAETDEVFTQRYSDCFPYPEMVTDGNFYHVRGVDETTGKLLLE